MNRETNNKDLFCNVGRKFAIVISSSIKALLRSNKRVIVISEERVPELLLQRSIED